MERRGFVRTLGCAALAWPLSLKAQPSTPVIGFLSARSPRESAEVVAAFRGGLREAGFVEGRDLEVAYRWADGRYERLRAFADELVRLHVALLFAAGGPPAVAAAKAATRTIPIVFSGSSDPVRLGFVSSLSRPGGNVTGMSLFTMTLVGKSVGLLHEVVPAATTIAYLVNPSNPSAGVEAKEAQAAASALGLQVHVLSASSSDDLDAAFDRLDTLHAGGLVVPADAFFDSHRDRIVALSARHATPAVFPWRDYVEAGGLISYGSSLTDSYRQAGVYCARILRGEKPAELPVQQPTKFELVVNLRTAKALRISLPEPVLLRADELIE